MVAFNQEEFIAFAKKLDEWSTTLTEKERAILQLVLERASAGSDELSEDQLSGVTGGTTTLTTSTTVPKFTTPIGTSALKVYKTLPGFTPPNIVGIVAPDM